MAARGGEQVVAVDEVGEHLEQVSFLARALDAPAVRPLETSLYRLHDHIEAESLDLVLLAGVLYHLSDMLVGLVAMQQLLKPGGVLLIESNAVGWGGHDNANMRGFARSTRSRARFRVSPPSLSKDSALAAIGTASRTCPRWAWAMLAFQ
jgi:SAM-dependent methyltransferase